MRRSKRLGNPEKAKKKAKFKSEACGATLRKSSKAAPKAAERLKITAPALLNLEIADGIIAEPLAGAHTDPNWMSQQIKIAINEAMDELTKLP